MYYKIFNEVLESKNLTLFFPFMRIIEFMLNNFIFVILRTYHCERNLY